MVAAYYVHKKIPVTSKLSKVRGYAVKLVYLLLLFQILKIVKALVTDFFAYDKEIFLNRDDNYHIEAGGETILAIFLIAENFMTDSFFIFIVLFWHKKTRLFLKDWIFCRIKKGHGK